MKNTFVTVKPTTVFVVFTNPHIQQPSTCEDKESRHNKYVGPKDNSYISK